MGRQSPEPAPDARFQRGRMRPLTFNVGPTVLVRLSPTRAPQRNNRPLARRLGARGIRTCNVCA
jgi:hypothetical protein